MPSDNSNITSLHLSAALAALGPIIARATLAGDGLGALLLVDLTQQIRDGMERLPEEETFSFFDPMERIGAEAEPATSP